MALSAQLDVLVASVHWRQEKGLVSAIADEGVRVEHTTSAAVALSYLSGQWQAKLVILGRELEGRNPFDLLFEAAKIREAEKRAAPRILLTQGIVSDYELLALLERRGVNAYLNENDDLSAHVRASTGILYAAHRASTRHPFKRPATVSWDGGEVHGKTTDLSLSGVGFVLDAKSARTLPPRGSLVSLLLMLDGPAFFAETNDASALLLPASSDAEAAPLLPCTIRSVSIKSRFLGDLAIVGLEFADPSERLMELVKRELAGIGPARP